RFANSPFSRGLAFAWGRSSRLGDEGLARIRTKIRLAFVRILSPCARVSDSYPFCCCLDRLGAPMARAEGLPRASTAAEPRAKSGNTEIVGVLVSVAPTVTR